MKRRKVFGTALVGLFAIVSGCASLNSQFDCPMKPGVMCKSLDEVNTMVDQGKLGGKSQAANLSSLSSSNIAPTFIIPCSHPTRSCETVARVWIAPYEDSDGDYYAPSLLYRIVKPSQWSAQPINALREQA
jgi:conjugal transfer pilus assembly protein TraV